MDNLTYDALGNRVCKIEKPRVVLSNGVYVRSTEDGWKYTYYVYDANGKVMATYNKVVTNRLASNQLGIAFNKLGNSIYDTNPNNSYFTSTKTEKVYELTNHLGNIQATVYDNKLPMTGSTTNTTTAQYYLANVASQTDYYAFGSEMRARTSGGGYRYGFNGQEKDDEISGAGNMMTAEYWEYDTRLGRRWNMDPDLRSKPWMSPYHAFSNKPIWNIDPNGASDNPVYDKEGSLLGTDDKGLKGDAIVMDKKDFVQGEKHEDELKKDLGLKGLKDKDAIKNFAKSFASLPNRPDYDGKITLDEANDWYRKGGGKPLFVDASKVNLDPVKRSDFGKPGDSFYKNFAFTSNDETGLVYGNIKLTLLNDEGVVKLGGKNNLLDITGYFGDIDPPNSGRYVKERRVT